MKTDELYQALASLEACELDAFAMWCAGQVAQIRVHGIGTAAHAAMDAATSRGLCMMAIRLGEKRRLARETARAALDAVVLATDGKPAEVEGARDDLQARMLDKLRELGARVAG